MSLESQSTQIRSIEFLAIFNFNMPMQFYKQLHTLKSFQTNFEYQKLP